MVGLLEERWLNFDDSKTDGTEWINEKGEKVKMRKAGFVDIGTICSTKTYFSLLPEFYLRHLETNYITFSTLSKEIDEIKKGVENLK
jgi:hypothetical protein